MLRGELTNLRAVERSDLGKLHHWFSDPDVMTYWGLPAATISTNVVQRWIEQWLEEERELQRPIAFIVEELDGTELGMALLSQHEALHRSCEVSLVIGEREEWGKGFGTDALSTLTETCFDQWGLHRVWLRVELSNER